MGGDVYTCCETVSGNDNHYFFNENICSIEDADSFYRITETIALLLVVYALLQNLNDLYADNLVNVE